MALMDRLFNCRSRRPVQQAASHVPAHLANDNQDRVEDGFILIGQTASERSTVLSNQQAPGDGNPNLPPSYESQMSLPTYTEACDMGPSGSSHMDMRRSQSYPLTGSQSQACSEQCSNNSHSHWLGADDSNQPDSGFFVYGQDQSALQDVPFAISSAASAHLAVHSFHVPYITINSMSQYSYDFSTEIQVLKDDQYSNL